MIRINVYPPGADNAVLVEVTKRDDEGNDNLVGAVTTANDLPSIVAGLQVLAVPPAPTE